MNNEAGYDQAIDNLAYAIDKLAAETLEPVMTNYGVTTPEEANEFLTEEEKELWEEIERIANVVAVTYGKTYDEVMDTVSAVMFAHTLKTLN